MTVKLPGSGSGLDVEPPLESYDAVAICCETGACPEAKSLRGKRLLSDEAPDLPLDTCSSSNCACQYLPYGDRRNFLTNRRLNVDLASELEDPARRRERRTGPDRRKIKINKPKTF
jgi:hypothetical protein